MLVKLEHPLKADPPIDVTEFGMMEFLQPDISSLSAVLIIALQLSLESYIGFPLVT